MRIIALQGKHNSGKTATLKKLIEMLQDRQGDFVFKGVHPKGDVLELCRKKGDMQYWCSYGGVKIGITTRGDARRYLNTDFYTKRRRNFSDRDIVVCAIRTYGGTVDFVNEYATNGLEIVPKDIVPDKEGKARQETANAEQAAMILRKLIELKEEIEVRK